MIDQKMERYFVDWAKREEVAESMVPLIGKLYRDYGVVTTIYGRSRCTTPRLTSSRPIALLVR